MTTIEKQKIGEVVLGPSSDADTVAQAEREARDAIRKFDKATRYVPAFEKDDKAVKPKRKYIRRAASERSIKANLRDETIDRLTRLTGIPGAVWGEEIIQEEAAILLKERSFNHNTSPRRVLAFELNGIDSDICIAGLEKLLRRVKSNGVESFKYEEPEPIESTLPVMDNDGNRIGDQPIVCGYVEVHVGPQPIRTRVIRRINAEGVLRGRETPKIDFASYLAEKDIYDSARVQPPKGGRLLSGRRFVQMSNVILDTDGRKKHIYIRAETVIPVEADGTEGAEVLLVYSGIHRMSDNKFVRWSDIKEIKIAFPSFVFLLPWVGKHIQGAKEIEDFIPLAPTDEELRKAGIDPATFRGR